MRVAFDTNVYDFICRADQAQAVRAWLDEQSHAVTASEWVILEIWRIADYARRTKQISTVTQVARNYTRSPGSYLQAQELLAEMRRLRRDWIRLPSREEKRRERLLLDGHRDMWRTAREFPGSTPDLLPYLDMTAGQDRDGQKRERQLILGLGGLREDLRASIPDFPDVIGDAPELTWRSKGLLTWSDALFERKRILRDYYDWLGPHLRLRDISRQEFASFWLRDLAGPRVPRSWMIGLAEYFQLGQKVTGGNALDLNHVLQVLDCDLFLTADRRFFNVLVDVRRRVQLGGKPGLVRQDRPVVPALAEAMAAEDT